MKKIILSGASDYHIRLAGIVSATPFYRLVWLINNHLGFNLSLVEDKAVSVAGSNGSSAVSLHTCYSYADEALELAWNLVKNRGTNGILLKTKPLSDYVITMRGEDYERSFERCTAGLQSMKDITAVIPVDFDKLKDKDNYI